MYPLGGNKPLFSNGIPSPGTAPADVKAPDAGFMSRHLGSEQESTSGQALIWYLNPVSFRGGDHAELVKPISQGSHGDAQQGGSPLF
jgi:hypothetical protein